MADSVFSVVYSIQLEVFGDEDRVESVRKEVARCLSVSFHKGERGLDGCVKVVSSVEIGADSRDSGFVTEPLSGSVADGVDYGSGDSGGDRSGFVPLEVQHPSAFAAPDPALRLAAGPPEVERRRSPVALSGEAHRAEVRKELDKLARQNFGVNFSLGPEEEES